MIEVSHPDRAQANAGPAHIYMCCRNENGRCPIAAFEYPRLGDNLVPDFGATKTKNPRRMKRRGFRVRTLAVTYFRMAAATLSSARSVFTSEFEMGSGGSRSL